MNQRVGSGRRAASPERRWIPVVVVCLLAALLLAGIALGMFQRGIKTGSSAGTGSLTTGTASKQDELSVSSAVRDASDEGKQTSEKSPEQLQGAVSHGPTHNDLMAQQQRQAAAQRAAQQAELDEKKRELELEAAAQKAKEDQLEQERRSVEAERVKAESAQADAERQRAAAAAAQMDRLKQEAAQREARAAGPTSGSIVWQGLVRGTTLVTINGNSSDTGQVVSGALPGVLVMVQPADAKHVGVASTPAPSNSYRRLTLRIQGNGVMQEVIRWSIP